MEKPIIENWRDVQRDIQNKPDNYIMIDTLKQIELVNFELFSDISGFV